MGQKVSPHGLRVGVIKDWDSKWYADKKGFADYLIEDNEVRSFIKKKLYVAGISKTVIERAADNQIKVTVMIDKPGIVVGRDGAGIKELKKALEDKTGKKVDVELVEVKRAELDAQLSAESIAQALEKRISFRRAMKQAIQRTMKANAKGIKVLVSGRLGGAEIARNEKYSEGNVPLHTLRANISYGFAEADTQYGKIGVKVWINLGERLEKGLMSSIPEETKSDRRDNKGRGRRDDRPRRDRNSGGYGGKGRGRRDDRDQLPKAVNPRKRKAPAKDESKVSTAEDREAAAKAEEAKLAAAAAETPVETAPVTEAAPQETETKTEKPTEE